MLKMDLEYVQGILFVRLKGKLLNRNKYKIFNYLNPIIKKHNIKYLVYNLHDLSGIDEIGIDAILSTKCTIKKQKGKIYLCKVNKAILLNLKRLHIKNISSEEAALKMIEV